MEYKINSCKYDIKKFISDIAINEFKIDYWDEWLEEQNYDILQELPNILISVEDNNKLIGICSIKKYNDEECYLNSFYVLKPYRNKGIGYKLFSMCEKYAKDNNYKRILLSVDPNFKKAISMYERNNYIFDHTEYDGKELWYQKDI